MNYHVRLHPQVDKFLRKCEANLSVRIKNKLWEIRENPFAFIERLETQDFYKLRIGDYRALIDVDLKRKIIFVRYIDHRKKIYKNMNK